MARINFEDDVEAQEEFWRLLTLVGNNRDTAIGRLIRFFRLAQKAFGYDIPITQDEIVKHEFTDMIESGWAVPVDGGFQCLGAEKHFSWYRQRVQSSVAGGRARSAAPRDEKGRLQPDSCRKPADNHPASSPLSLSLSLSLSQKKEEKEEKFQLTENNLSQAYEAWLNTLTKMKMGRSNLIDREKEAIGRAIQRDGVLAVVSALNGVAFAPKDDFDSSWFSDVTRVLNPKNFLRFVNLGIQQLHKEHKKT